MKVLPIKSIQRNQSRLSANDGACDEIINLRYKDGEWKLMPHKDVVYDASHISYISNHTNWYHHPVTPDSWFIAKQEQAYDLDTIQLVKASVPTTTPIHTLNGTEVLTKIYHFGYFLIINTTENVYYLKFDGDTEEYTLLPEIEHGLYSISSTFGETASSYGDSISTVLSNMRIRINELENKGLFNGHTFFRIGFKMEDGNVIMPTAPYYSFIGLQAANEYGSSEIPNIVYDGATGSYEGSWKKFSKPYVKFDFTQDQIDNLNLYEGIIKSVVIYCTKPLMDRDQSVTKISNESGLLYVDQIGDTINEQYFLYVYPYIDSDRITNLHIKTSLYYEVHSTPVNELELDMYVTIDVGDINTIVSKSNLPVDPFSSHKIFSDVEMEYNSKLHIGTPLVKLSDGFNLSYTENTGNTSALLDKLIGVDNRVFTGTVTPRGDDIYAIVKLYINNKEKLVYRKLEKVYVCTNSVESINYIILNSILEYPDSRAKSIQLAALDSSMYFALTEEIPLNSHQYLNMATSDEDYYTCPATYEQDSINIPDDKLGIRLFRYRSIELTFLPVITFTKDNVYTDTNRIQVSELNNILYYPSENSYRIGKLTNEILGIASQAIPMSQGQFGQYPLTIFSTNGIFVLEQGTGDIFYKSIHPVTHDICNNKKSIIGINGGILFSSGKGLMVMSGGKVTEISQTIEGDPDTFLNNNIIYHETLNGTLNVVDLKDALSTIPFKEYMEDVVIAYDQENDEIILSNTKLDGNERLYNYNYIFNSKSGAWYKSSQVFDEFITNYPNGYGIKDGIIYGLTNDAPGELDILVKTRPFILDTLGLKTIKRLLARYIGESAGGNQEELSLYLFGSLNGKSWTLINGVRMDAITAAEREIMIRNARSTARYFVIVFAVKAEDAVINYFELSDEKRAAKKLR